MQLDVTPLKRRYQSLLSSRIYYRFFSSLAEVVYLTVTWSSREALCQRSAKKTK